MLGISVRPSASSDPIMPLRRASPTIFRTAESRTFTVEGESDPHARPPLHQQRPGERPAGTEGEQVVSGKQVDEEGDLKSAKPRVQARSKSLPETGDTFGDTLYRKNMRSSAWPCGDQFDRICCNITTYAALCMPLHSHAKEINTVS